MASIIDPKELILHFTHVNCNYMRLPAGEQSNYRAISNLYQSLAEQSRVCAQSWRSDLPAPWHEPAVDAFWWAVVAWADAFGISIGADPTEWGRKFVKPHFDFACYLRPGEDPEPIEPHFGHPDEIIMELDVRWMKRVMTLTGRWGWFHHLKDMAALQEAHKLEGDLRDPNSGVREAYLRSDLNFFVALFEPVPFEVETSQQIKDWLATSSQWGMKDSV